MIVVMSNLEADTIKINDTENARFDSTGILHIDGASYLPDSDYEWFFSIGRSELSKLYAELSDEPVTDEELPHKFIDLIKEKGINVSRLKDICELKEIEHSFSSFW